MKVFVDSNIFVYAAQANPQLGKACRKIVDDIEQRRIDAVTSIANIAEVGEVIDRHAGRETAVNVIELLLALPMDVEGVVKEHAVEALSVFSVKKANYFDTIFLAVMREKFIDTIITNDSHFDKFEGITVIKPLDYKSPK